MANCSHRLMQCAMGLLLGMVLLLAGNRRADGSVKFSVTGDDGKPVTDAVITLDGVAQAAGNYTFEPVTDGRKAYRVTREGYDPVGGQYCVVDYQGKPLCVDVVMQVEDDVDLSDVFWYNQNIFCKLVDGTLSMSLDHGRSYSHSIDLSAVASDSSDIKTLWIFGDHSLFFADLTRCFYSHDWKTYHESAVFGIDGEPFVPNPRDHNFSRLSYHVNRPIIGDRELYVWGNYSTGSSAYNNINIWMTSDKGKTVRSTYKFRDQRSDTDNPILFARHMHRVDFCPLDNTLWAQSGDHSRDGVHEQHWLLGRYDHLTDTLTWKHLQSGKFAASGNRFKSLNIDWRQGYMRWSCDTGAYRGGAFRVPYVPGPGNIEQIVNPAEHKQLKGTQNDASGHLINDNGEMVIFQLRWGGSAHPHVFYYSSGHGKAWHDIEGPVINHTGSLENYWFGSRFGFTDGIDRMLARPCSLAGGTVRFMDPIDLARFVRNIGFFNAFRPAEDVAPSNLHLTGGVIRTTDPAGTVVGVLSAAGIPAPTFELIGKPGRVALDQRTRRQLILREAPSCVAVDAPATESITVRAVNRAGASEPITFPLTTVVSHRGALP